MTEPGKRKGTFEEWKQAVLATKSQVRALAELHEFTDYGGGQKIHDAVLIRMILLEIVCLKHDLEQEIQDLREQELKEKDSG